MPKPLTMASDLEDDLRESIIECGQICYERHLLTSNDGNISVRQGEDRVLITASGVSKGRMLFDDLLLINLEGAILAAKPGVKLWMAP